MKKICYAHVDCNNFFVSCERVFQPFLKNEPVIVLSNNDGCVVARSQEVKKMGIPISIPFFKIKDFAKKNNIFVFSSNYTLYADMSERVFRVLSTFSEDIFKYSIDESFLKFESPNLKSISQLASEIACVTKKWTGIPVSVGFGPTKTLAKLCTYWVKKYQKANKKNYYIYYDERSDELLAATPVEKVWGIGKRYGSHLIKKGIKTAKDLKNADEKWIDSVFGITVLRTVRELKCDSCIEIENVDSKKSILRSGSFGKPITEFETLNQAVALFVSRAAMNLRKRNLLTKVMTISIMTSKYSDEKYYSSVPLALFTPSDNTMELLKYSRKCLERIFKPEYVYRRAGVSLECLVKKSSYQAAFFGNYDRNREEKVLDVMDKLNNSMGKNKIFLGALGNFEIVVDRKTRLSKKFTTKWAEIPEVKSRH